MPCSQVCKIKNQLQQGRCFWPCWFTDADVGKQSGYLGEISPPMYPSLNCGSEILNMLNERCELQYTVELCYLLSLFWSVHIMDIQLQIPIILGIIMPFLLIEHAMSQF